MGYDYDLLIVGGGLVGGNLALGLRNSPLRIGMIESVPQTQRLAAASGDRALALAWGSAQILDQLGVWRAAKSRAVPIKHIHVSDRGHFGKVRLSAQREGVDALGYVVTARVLEEVIAESLRRSSVVVHCPARIIGVKSGSDGVHVSMKQGGESHNLTARLLVAADGGNSTVRQLLEIGQSLRDYGQTAIVTEVSTERSNRFTAYERFTSSGPLAFLPAGKSVSSVVWTRKADDAEELLAMSDAEFTERLQAAFGFWLGRISLASARQGFPLRLVQAERMVEDRIVLVGNAVHQLHPVAGQGFNLGLRDVALLVEMLLAWFEFREDIGARAFLDRYARARQDDLSNVIRFTDSLVRIFSNDFVPLALTRNLGLVALDNWGQAKRFLAQYAMGLSDRIPRFG
jgi:2-octaprenyl-6-methoxyphenol hydroxylase